MSQPAVSLIVPSYNAGRYLQRLCESILAQTFKDFEVLIGDDGSTDNSVEVLQPFLGDSRFKLIQWKPNRGLHFGLTVLLNAAHGQFWCSPGADDILEPQFLEQRVPRLASRPEAALIHGPARWIDENDRPYASSFTQRSLPELIRRIPESLTGGRMLRILLQHNIINQPSALVRMDVTRLVLPWFSPWWVWAPDWALWMLLAATGFDFLWDAKPLLLYRAHSGSLSGSPQKKIVRRTERKLTPFYTLHVAGLFSPQAKSLWVEQRKALYRWWLVTAFALHRERALTDRDMLFAAEAYRGALPRSVCVWREMAVHGLPALRQYGREKQANARQLFQVSGFSLVDDPLFRA